VNKALKVLFWLVVGASLLANAVVLGLLLRLGELRDIANGGSAGFAGLPAGTRAEVREALGANREALAGPLAALGEARRAMFAAAAARPFDRAALDAAMAKVRDATLDLQEAAHAVMLDAYAGAAAEGP
jgi:uncharacterized membrane protein